MQIQYADTVDRSVRDAVGYSLTKWKNICTINADRGELRLFDTRLKPCKRLYGRRAEIRLTNES